MAPAAASAGGSEVLFADDLSAFKKFALDVATDDVIEDLQRCRREVHRWGNRNRVVFDAGKEHLAIIHPSRGFGNSFKLLGCMIDVKLHMDEAIDLVVAQARPKIKAMLRTRGIYSHSAMFIQYKTHIWGITEYCNGAILHASNTALGKLERLQRSFVHEMHITEEVAFVDHGLAPPSLRRDIGILGFLHKRVLGQAHTGIEQLLPMIGACPPWHDKQIESHMQECIRQQVIFYRSLFGMVLVYNRLPQAFVNIDSVQSFQSALTHVARTSCLAGSAGWRSMFRRKGSVPTPTD